MLESLQLPWNKNVSSDLFRDSDCYMLPNISTSIQDSLKLHLLWQLRLHHQQYLHRLLLRCSALPSSDPWPWHAFKINSTEWLIYEVWLSMWNEASSHFEPQLLCDDFEEILPVCPQWSWSSLTDFSAPDDQESKEFPVHYFPEQIRHHRSHTTYQASSAGGIFAPPWNLPRQTSIIWITVSNVSTVPTDQHTLLLVLQNHLQAEVIKYGEVLSQQYPHNTNFCLT